MKIKNIEDLKERVKGHLKEYLEGNNTTFKGSHFTCPNREVHNHEDDKPSAAFYPGPDGFKCFGCELAGDIFTVAHYIDGKPLSGPEFITDNLLYLADMFDEPYEAEDYTPDELKKKELYEALEDACKLSYRALRSDKAPPEALKVKKYIEDRGWKNLIEDFEFGFCIYDKLVEVLKKKGYSDETLINAGILSAEGKEYEKYLFNERLVFPIRNHYGKVIAFGSRLIEAPKNEHEQKYLQSRNTALYNKTNVLFNMDKARNRAKVYIVEGYADVFTLHKHGIKNVVALCGLSFNETRYKILVQSGVKQAVFCLDNDSAGKAALERIVNKELKKLKGIDVYVKEIPQEDDIKDVDEFISKKGADAFKTLPEPSVFDWKLDRLKDNSEDDVLRADLIEEIVFQENYTRKESMSKKLAKAIDISHEAILKEAARHEHDDKGVSVTTSEDILEEVKCFERVVNDWDRKVWSRTGNLLGLKTNRFPILEKQVDGIQNMYYIFAGQTNIGKSALLLNMSMDIVESNEDVFVLFFSVDDTISQLVPRILALKTDMAINAMSNPKFKIKFNNDLTEQEKERMLIERAECIEGLKGLAERFAIKEESEAKYVEDIEKYIKIYKKLAGTKQLVVFIDNLHRMGSRQRLETRQLYMHISDTLKLWKTKYDVPILATAELRKINEGRPTLADIKETNDFIYDADLVGLLYSDFYSNSDTMLKFVPDTDVPDGGGELEKPVVEVNFAKNKTSEFKSTIYYKFYPEYSKYVECSWEEIRNIRAQVQG